jgi:hypothetical protein
MRNQEICKVQVSENIQAIANCIKENISGGKAGTELIQWCENNQDKLQSCGFHNYNCLSGQVDFDNQLEDDFDALLDIVQPLRLR